MVCEKMLRPLGLNWVLLQVCGYQALNSVWCQAALEVDLGLLWAGNGCQGKVTSSSLIGFWEVTFQGSSSLRQIIGSASPDLGKKIL